jgi:hypothetical protein
VSPRNPTGAPGRTAFFLNGAPVIDRDTSAITVPVLSNPIVFAAKADGTLPFTGELTRLWVAEGVALPDSWWRRAEVARISGATTMSDLDASPRAFTVVTTVGGPSPIHRSVMITQNIAGANPAFTITPPDEITVTGSLVAPSLLDLSIDTSGMTADTVLAVRITPADLTQSPFDILVTVDMATSELEATPAAIELFAQAGATVSNTVRLTVSQNVEGGLTGFTIVSDATWLIVSQV